MIRKFVKHLTLLTLTLLLFQTASVQAAQVQDNTLHVVLWYNFFIPRDFETVAREASRITKEKTGLDVQFLPVISATIQNTLSMARKEGISIDVSSVSDTRPMNDLLETYGRDILKIATPEELSYTRQNGILYTLPSKADYVASAGIAFRKDILTKYNIDASQIKTLDDLDQLFAFLHEKEKDLTLVAPLSSQRGFLIRFYTFRSIPNTVFDFQEDSDTLINFYASDQYRNMVKTIRKWYLAGYLPSELSLKNALGTELMQTGNLFSYFCACKPGIEWEESVSSGCEIVVIPLQEACITNASTQTSSWGITKESRHPEQAMQFLNFLYSDRDLVDLLINGIEGIHYERLPDGTIDFPEGVTAQTSGYYPNIGWSYPNQMLSSIWNGNDPELWEKTKQFQHEAKVQESVGFAFDPSPVESENTLLNEIAQKYAYGLETGALDPEIYLPQMLNEMEAAGSAKVEQEILRQYSDWKSAPEKGEK